MHHPLVKLFLQGIGVAASPRRSAKFSKKMEKQGYFVAFFSVSDLIEMSDVNHVNILYSIALSLLNKATQNEVDIPDDTRKSLLEWFTSTQTDTVTKYLKSEIGVGGDFLKIITALQEYAQKQIRFLQKQDGESNLYYLDNIT